MNYKEVFQLAQDKGYDPNEHPYYCMPSADDKAVEFISLMELTLIQKWLRDEHKITIERVNLDLYSEWYYVFKLFSDGRLEKGNYSNLLQGINEALKLI